MAVDFLSEDWFAAIDTIRDEVGRIEVEGPAKDLVFNINVKDTPYGTVSMHVAGGNMERGLADNAPTTLNLPYGIAYAMFIKNDQSAGMNGFMSGQISVEGDMTKLMAMGQGAQPENAAVIQQKIAEVTAPIE